MKNMTIYEPAMCCETGLCGVGVDPELLRVSAVLNALKKHGVPVNRYNLSSAPMEFIRSKPVTGYLNDKGVEGLPIVTLDGEIVITGRYPTDAEFVALLGVRESDLGGAAAEAEPEPSQGCGCGCSGGSCC